MPSARRQKWAGHNTAAVAPALGIFFACVAELEQDGLMIFVAFFWLFVTVLYFVVVIAALWFLGDQALAYFRW